MEGHRESVMAMQFGVDWEDDEDYKRVDNMLEVVHSVMDPLRVAMNKEHKQLEKHATLPRMGPTNTPKKRENGSNGSNGSNRSLTLIRQKTHASDNWPETGGFQDLLQRAIRDRRAVLSNLRQPFLVLPNSTFRMAWDISMATFLMYVAVFTPFQMAFLAADHDIATPQEWPFFFALDRLVDLIFLVDMGINFRSAWYITDINIIFFNQNEAIRRYLKGWFALDFLALLPWDALPLIFNFDSSSGLRLPKLLKLVRLMKILKVVGANRILRRMEQNMGVKYGVVRLIKFTVMLCAIAHWLACALMFFSTFDDPSTKEGHEEDDRCFLAQDGVLEGKWRWSLYCGCTCDTSETYLAALYWSIMTLTTIGYGDVGPQNASEMIFVSVSMLVGAGVFSFVVGTCCSLVEGLDKAGLQFQEEFDAVNDYMSVCGVDANMRRRVRAYIWNYRDLSTRRNEQEILNLMSPSLQQAFILHNYAKMIRGIPPLKGAPDTFVVEMAGTAVRSLYGPRDTICYQWSIGDLFYCLKKGEVISCRSPKPGAPIEFVTRFRNSGYWNERLLAFNSYVDCSIKAMTFTEVVAFDSENIREILLRFPQGQSRVKQSVLRRLWKFCASKVSVRHAINAIKNQMLADNENMTAASPPKSRGQKVIDAGVFSRISNSIDAGNFGGSSSGIGSITGSAARVPLSQPASFQELKDESEKELAQPEQNGQHNNGALSQKFLAMEHVEDVEDEDAEGATKLVVQNRAILPPAKSCAGSRE